MLECMAKIYQEHTHQECTCSTGRGPNITANIDPRTIEHPNANNPTMQYIFRRLFFLMTACDSVTTSLALFDEVDCSSSGASSKVCRATKLVLLLLLCFEIALGAKSAVAMLPESVLVSEFVSLSLVFIEAIAPFRIVLEKTE